MSLHQQALDRIAGYDCTDPRCTPRASTDRCTRHVLAAALRAAVELHAPTQFGGRAWCVPCCREEPCETVRAIARELGIEVNDR